MFGSYYKNDYICTIITENDMDIFDAIIDIECNDVTQERYIECYQTLIDSGVVWELQGSHGRTASMLISQGLCHE